MNKKANTVIFILCGTVVNLLLACAFIIAFLFLTVQFQPMIGDKTGIVIPLAFFAGLILSMVVYQKLSKWVITRFKLEDKLDPLIKTRSRSRRD